MVKNLDKNSIAMLTNLFRNNNNSNGITMLHIISKIYKRANAGNRRRKTGGRKEE